MLALTLRFGAKGQALVADLAPESEPSDQVAQSTHQQNVDVPMQQIDVRDEESDNQDKEPDGDRIGHIFVSSPCLRQTRGSADF